MGNYEMWLLFKIFFKKLEPGQQHYVTLNVEMDFKWKQDGKKIKGAVMKKKYSSENHLSLSATGMTRHHTRL